MRVCFDVCARLVFFAGYQPVSRIGEVVINAFGALLPFLTHVHGQHTHYHTLRRILTTLVLASCVGS